MLKKIGLTVLLATLAGAASANDSSCKPEQFWWFTIDICTPVDHHTSPASAPEIDPASAMSALTLVLGGLAVIRSRRKNSGT